MAVHHAFWETVASLNKEEILQTTWQGLAVVLFTIAMTVVLEFGLCMDTVRRVQKQPNGKSLYVQGWIYSLCNPIFIGAPIYGFVARLFCSFYESPSIQQHLIEIIWIAACHSVQYYLVHKALHEHSFLYQRFHRFHHRFHTHVPPSAANAVTVGEYLLAYMMPFLFPTLMAWNYGAPLHAQSMRRATMWISIANIFVHTPYLEELSQKWLPDLFVSTNNHLDHHRKLNSYYASPTFNIDSMVQYGSSLVPPGKSKDNEQEAVPATTR